MITSVIAGLTGDQIIQLVGTGIGGLVLLVGVGSLAVSVVNERKRTQPIVVANEATERQFSSSRGAMWSVEAHLTSEGGGPAFNVRFGVEFAGVRYPYRYRIEDPESGNVQRVLKPGERRPPEGAWAILIDSLSMLGRAGEAKGELDAKRVYWARYENAQKHTWETRNPGDRSAKLDIRRIRWVKRHEWREQRRRKKAGQHDRDWVTKALAELREGAKPPPNDAGKD